MSIRVAYDVSFLARFFDQPGEQSGVFRVVEELLYALSRRDDVALTAVALCGDDPLADSVKSLRYVESRARDLSCAFEHAFRSRLGLSRLYARVFAAAESNGLGRPAPPLLARPLRGLLYRLAYTYGVDRLRHSLDAHAFDVFHSPFPKLPPREVTGGLPRLLTIYDLISVNHPQFMPASVVALAGDILRSIDVERDWVTCISEHVKGEFCEHTGMSPERVFVTPLAAAEHFRPLADSGAITDVRRRYGIPEGDYFLAVGVFHPRKNLPHLLRCFFSLLAERPGLPVKLVLAGSEGQGRVYDEALTVLSLHAELKSNVVFAGHIKDEDLAALYNGARAFIYPSLYEGFGLPPLEAMACGTPVITSNTTSLPEVVGDAGLMVDPRDEDALCQAMLDVLRDEGLRAKLSRRGLERAGKFSWDRCAAETARAYQWAAA